ncbi:MAG: hypothetical protein HY865_07050 [Chloroflexi bacterium]|nr:hypothetical protein [Chloroflexota bacterium]
MFRKIVRIVTAISVALGMFMATSPALAHSEGDGNEVKGIIAAVDATASTVTITPQGGGMDVVLTVDAITLIKRNDKPATLADLQMGDKVEAKYNAVTLVASKIEAELDLSELEGVISALDSTAGTVTVTRQDSTTVTVTVNPTTLIKRNKKAATLADLQLGDKVEVKYNAMTLIASKIEAKLNLSELKGIITALDSAAGTVTVTRQDNTTVTVTVDASTLIKRNKKAATLADLQLGDKVEVKYNAVTLLASKIEAKLNLSELKGIITALDSAASTVTVTRKDGTTVTVTVDVNTLIKRNGKLATFADLQLGDKVEAKYNAVTLVASKIEAKLNLSELKGVISALDSAASIVTVTRKDGTTVTVTVDASALIKRNGKPATLADLQLGDKAEVKYNAVTLVASKIEAKH